MYKYEFYIKKKKKNENRSIKLNIVNITVIDTIGFKFILNGIGVFLWYLARVSRRRLVEAFPPPNSGTLSVIARWSLL